MSPPLLSVLTATYNGEEFVAETIESVLAQTYPEIEHVIVDDASTDATAEIVEDYARRHPERVRLVRSRERAGPCRRRNDALDSAHGSVLAWLDHDDLWVPEKTQRQLDALDADPRAGFAYTQYELFDHATGAALARTELDAEGDVLRRLFVEGCIIGSSTVLIRREAMARRDLRFRDREFVFGDDYFLWLSLALDWRLARVDDVLTRVRKHDRNASAGDGSNWLVSSVALLEEFVATYPDAAAKLGPARRIGVGRHWAWAALYDLDRGRRLHAALYASRAAVRDPAGALRFAARTAGHPRRSLGRLAGAL